MTLSLLVADEPSPDFAAVFTRNAFPGAPVLIGRRRLAEPALRAIIVNNKISNVCAPDGEAASEAVCTAVAETLGCASTAVLPASTGVIGWRLPVTELTAAVPDASQALQSTSILPAAAGICTTDLYPKVRRAEVGAGSIVGIAKGAGMIEPDMATMLVYILTDCAVPRERLRALLPAAVATSFNAISVDSDQSTSDSVVLWSSGRVPCAQDAFAEALRTVCADLAEDVVRNGEGVHHVVRCTVAGAPDAGVAKDVARAIVNSPLLQCAICGNDPNVGRLVMAVGKEIGSRHPGLDLSRARMAMAGAEVFAEGVFTLDTALEERLSRALREAELYASAAPDAAGVFRPPIDYPPHERSVPITVDLGCGEATCTMLGADRSHEYISENADYRS